MTLTTAQLDEIREQLAERQRVLKSSFDEQISEMKEQDEIEQGGMDRGDLSNLEHETELHIERTHREAYELSLIDDALGRIDRGEYGQCIECSSTIESDRLLANPISKRCLNCQAAREEDQDERDSTPSL